MATTAPTEAFMFAMGGNNDECTAERSRFARTGIGQAKIVMVGHAKAETQLIDREICRFSILLRNRGIIMINYKNFTDKSLQLMHDAVHEAIALDTKAKKRGEQPPCRTSETKD
jgi:hypothetical protein